MGKHLDRAISGLLVVGVLATRSVGLIILRKGPPMESFWVMKDRLGDQRWGE
jgi:hypothetical protein